MAENQLVVEGRGRAPGPSPEKVELYCRHRVEGNSAAESIRKAYPTTRKWKAASVARKAHDFDKLEVVQQRLTELRRATMTFLDMRQERVMAEFAALGFSNFADVCDDDGQLMVMSKIPIHAQRAIRKYEQTRITDPDGNEIVKTVVEMHNKQPALNVLAEVVGMKKGQMNAKDAAKVNVTIAADGRPLPK